MNRLYLGIVIFLVIIIIGVLIYTNLNNKEKFNGKKCKYLKKHKFINSEKCKLSVDPIVIYNLREELRSSFPYYKGFSKNWIILKEGNNGNYIFSKRYRNKLWGPKVKNFIINKCKEICKNHEDCKGFHYHLSQRGDILVSFYAKNPHENVDCTPEEYNSINPQHYRSAFKPPIYYECK